ncbi:cytochrome P450 [Emericellopsis atlantica]|uniref:Cytochrome P450 n=1 Tax=Emericellopsis atlantica TaxID=2614577 RepID=A0A9P7ZEW7_9HYPO|nr:cytochrome P450 [Emericellopsis atlantica]KAG9250218.1 cytochrome P450 [Emericellopsis atlantica]
MNKATQDIPYQALGRVTTISYSAAAMIDTISIVATAVIFALTVFFLTSSKDDNGGAPKLLKLPIIGDLHSSPIGKPLQNWDVWSKTKGAIATANLFGIAPIVVINTSEAATELLSKRSAWYSNRPSSVSVEMITGAGPGQSKFTLMHDMDDHLRLHHRILAPSLGPIAAPKYQPVMQLEAKQLLVDMLALLQPSDDKNVVQSAQVYPLLERTQASNILALHYGLRVPTVGSPIYHEIVEIQKKVTHTAANPGIPDFIPPVRHLPAVLSPWKRAANKLYEEQTRLYLRLLKHGDEAEGWNATKQARTVAAKHAPGGIPDIDLAYTLATSIQGGMETSPRALLWLFIAAISSKRDFMSRAHALLDKVVGRDRLPTFADRPQLAYIDAIVWELMRWRPISPGSIPRRADRADEFKTVPIVKNATVFANAWSIGRDPEAFAPELGALERFVPERWLEGERMKEDVTAQGELRTSLPLPVFGQGRRSCMGKRVALDGSFMQVAALIWAFDFEPVDEVDDLEMVVVGFMTEPKPFRFRLKPRGDWVRDVVAREYASADKDVCSVLGAVVDIESK